MNLTQQELDDMLTEMVTGKRLFFFGDQMYAVTFPTMHDRDVSRIVYNSHFRLLVADGLPTVEDMRRRIKQYDLLERGFYSKVDGMKEAILNLQKTREATHSQTQAAAIEVQIEEMIAKLALLERQEMNLLVNTANVRAEQVKGDYLVSRCTFTGQELERRVWPTFDAFGSSTDIDLCNCAREKFSAMLRGFEPEAIRALARSLGWKRIWKASKNTGSPLFAGDAASWDSNKLGLCHWSEFYDAIYGYHEPPEEDIINDDSKLFEWIRQTNRLNAEKKKKGAKVGQGGETVKVGTPYRIRPGSVGKSKARPRGQAHG